MNVFGTAFTTAAQAAFVFCVGTTIIALELRRILSQQFSTEFLESVYRGSMN